MNIQTYLYLVAAVITVIEAIHYRSTDCVAGSYELVYEVLLFTTSTSPFYGKYIAL